MLNFKLHDKNFKIEFAADKNADSGLKKVISKVINDYNEITGEELETIGEDLLKSCVFAGIAGESEILDKLSGENRIDLSDVTGRWEVYKYFIVDESLIIAGSDKLGAIYGLFNLSEEMGISPLRYIADSVIPKKCDLSVSLAEEASREPSVKFRGFFINDEWPCYGNWTMEHFGGFNAKMYDHIFELLLRLKGNYLWPAMWTSCFALDGPGLKNYELATEYGIYIGNSHHEPCLRAGEEYSKVRGKGSIYGDAWNYHANTEGITRFWKDSLNERGGFTSVVTVGMRGEADSKILSEDATLKDNIDLLKAVIKCQNGLIKEAEKKFNKKFPKMLALYKEVEPFYYGDENTEGLCDWDELDDTILMLCEDNHGYLRTLPDEKMRKHPAGFGMYYHVDYHGAPISYEWINSSPISLMWEQMSEAYEYGVRSMWILNVGDLKHNEFPLSYFMNLAYDFDKWGLNNPNNTEEYILKTLDKHFGGLLPELKIKDACDILTETVKLLSYRRPEAVNASIYHACHFNEADRMLSRIYALEDREGSFYESLETEELRDAWYSLSGFQTRAGMALLKMHLYSAKNQLMAKQGLKSANDYAEAVAKAITDDEIYRQQFAFFKNGKWKGHEMAAHIGFTKWNEDGSKNPLQIMMTPVNNPRMYVCRMDDEKVYDKVYGPCMKMYIDDFMYEGCNEVIIKVANAGFGSFKAEVLTEDISFAQPNLREFTVDNEVYVTFSKASSLLTKEAQTTSVIIKGADTRVELIFKGKKFLEEVPEGTVLPGPYGFSFAAKAYTDSYAPKGSEWVYLLNYGVYDSGMKVLPSINPINSGDEPWLEYTIYVENPGEYTLQADFTPSNPLDRRNVLRGAFTINSCKRKEFNTLPAGYRAGEGSDRVWSEGVLTHRRSVKLSVNLDEGINKIRLYETDPGLVPLKLFIYKDEMPKSYFGMPDTAIR